MVLGSIQAARESPTNARRLLWRRDVTEAFVARGERESPQWRKEHHDNRRMGTKEHGITRVSEDKYPRVLVVNGEPFSQDSATGQTMCSLFKGWPRTRLACLYTSRQDPDRTVCEHYWRLPFSSLRCISNLMGEPVLTEKAETASAGDSAPVSAKSNRNNESAVYRYTKWLKRYLSAQTIRNIRDVDIYRIPAQILKEMDAFRPQVVYSMLGGNPFLQLVIDITGRHSIPVVPHFMDDWPTTLYRSSPFRFLLRSTMSRRLNTVLNRSPKRMVIGDAMAQEYAARYGGEFLPFMNAVEPDILKQPVIPPKPRQKVRLVYIGGLHLNRWRSLRDIASALEQLRKEGLEVEGLVYSQPRFAAEANKLNIPPVMRFVGALAPSEIPTVLRDADIVLHVESFLPKYRKYTRYSVSTKIPECMASSRPILAYGPEELASIGYVRASGCGLAVGRQEHGNLVASLRELVASSELRERLGSRGHLVASKRHNAALQREHFRSVLRSVIRMTTSVQQSRESIQGRTHAR